MWTAAEWKAAVAIATEPLPIIWRTLARAAASLFFSYIARNPNWFNDLLRYQRENG
jgi:hypothetical protein